MSKELSQVTDQTKLEVVDVDGALRETAHDAMEALESEGDTRAGFFKKAGLAGGAAMGSGALLSALVPDLAAAKAKGAPPAKIFGKGDIGILQYALQLEYLESSFYNEASANQRKRKFLKDPQEQIFLKKVTADEAAHVKFLKAGLGKAALPKPKYDFGTATSNGKQFLKASYIFENEGVNAYFGQAGNIKTPKYLVAAASILTIEARHAAVVGFLARNSGMGIAPDGAFDEPKTASQVLKDVSSLHYIKSGPLAS